MKRVVVWSLCAVVLGVGVTAVVGQMRKAAELGRRLESSRGLNRMPTTASAGLTYSLQVRKRLCDALDAATVDSLQKPVLAVCAQYRISGPLFVQWIEDHPTPDSIQVLASDGETVHIAAIDQRDAEANRESTKTDVVFAASFSVPPEVLRKASRPVRVALAKGRQRLSNAVEIMWVEAGTTMPK